MGKQAKTAITPTRSQDYPEWYQQVVKASDLAENSPVRGCMVIKPWGYAIWENIRGVLDGMFKETGVKNAYFPLFIPKRFLEKEAEHVEGFAKECAVVTHHRLEEGEDGSLVPAGLLEEPLVVRPTSETIIGESFSRWVSSYRDLPLLINQWCNVVRWEMRTRIFLRTSEFLWQEGHTAHVSANEAMERTLQMLDMYAKLAESYFAIPVIKGEKTASERFPGAVNTYTVEAMMQDRKALQAGTSHFLGQNFARASEIKYQSAQKKEEYAWTTSWGVSTRLIGAIIMMHGDDNGLVLPPMIASSHVALMPIIKKAGDRSTVMDFTHTLATELRGQHYHGRKIEVEIDDRETGGGRVWDWIKKGIPLRVEIGPRDIARNSVFVGRRDRGPREKESIPRDQFIKTISPMLDEMQKNLFDRALRFREENTTQIDSKEDFFAFFTPQNPERPEIHGGFALAHWCGNQICEEKIKTDLSVTIRCIPSDAENETGKCIACGDRSPRRVVFAKAY
ncbi:MAG: proline--tRNA ligase [Deltaproteobacteria bacterium]|nr:proline--tRNA ligase [Deltaproteobacteria bacterium]MBW1794714.1 proline--tRNA ligase [Deltaproteobacteria bacterium]